MSYSGMSEHCDWVTREVLTLYEASHVTFLTDRMMHDGPVGCQEFKDSGKEFFGYYTGLCRLKPDETMLDVGSGVGRKTFLLTDYITEPGCYKGIDVVKAAIDWCTERITRTSPCFRFQLIDVYNRYYNPACRFNAADYEFPFARDSFDFAVLASVFTRALPEGSRFQVASLNLTLASLLCDVS